MRCAFGLPGGDPRTCAELAAAAEAAGWDGVFVPDSISIDAPGYPPSPTFDPWVTLAAMAMRTERIRLGTMVTPLPRRRSWKVARETVSLDYLSGGRLTLCVGLGAAADDAGFSKVGEPMDLVVRAELLDEGLAVLGGLWGGRSFSFQGKHYRVQGMTLVPAPVQSPRIPVWVVGVWPRPKSMARSLQWDGVIVQMGDGSGKRPTPEDVAALRAYCQARRTPGSAFDIVVEGETPGEQPVQASAITHAYAEAGATWWIESSWDSAALLEDAHSRIRQGPPRG